MNKFSNKIVQADFAFEYLIHHLPLHSLQTISSPPLVIISSYEIQI